MDDDLGSTDKKRNSSTHEPLRSWESVLLGGGVLLAAALLFVPPLAEVSSAVLGRRCGSFDFGCFIGTLVPGAIVGFAAAILTALVVVQWWRRKPLRRPTAWLIGVGLPLLAALVATAIWG